MAGLVSAIHDFLHVCKDVDARHEAGHDLFHVAILRDAAFDSASG